MTKSFASESNPPKPVPPPSPALGRRFTISLQDSEGYGGFGHKQKEENLLLIKLRPKHFPEWLRPIFCVLLEVSETLSERQCSLTLEENGTERWGL